MSVPSAGHRPVGVVIATRNRCERLPVTLRHLLRLPEHPDVLVVDNASTDGTRAMLAQDFPEVRVLALPVNHGARALGTPYVAFSDDDSWWAPGALTRAAELFDAHPRLGLIAARTLVGTAAEPDPLNDILAASPLGPATDLPGTQVLGFLACGAVVRRSAHLDAGGFHRLLFFGGEEILLAYDLAARGWGVSHCPRRRRPPPPGPHGPHRPPGPPVPQRPAHLHGTPLHRLRRRGTKGSPTAGAPARAQPPDHRHSSRNAANSATGHTPANAQIAHGAEVMMPVTMSATATVSSAATVHLRGR